MWTVRFWRDLAERAISTAAQAVLLNIGFSTAGPINAFKLDWMLLIGFALAGGVLSALKSLAAAKATNTDSASLIK